MTGRNGAEDRDMNFEKHNDRLFQKIVFDFYQILCSIFIYKFENSQSWQLNQQRKK